MPETESKGTRSRWHWKVAQRVRLAKGEPLLHTGEKRRAQRSLRRDQTVQGWGHILAQVSFRTSQAIGRYTCSGRSFQPVHDEVGCADDGQVTLWQRRDCHYLHRDAIMIKYAA